MMLKIISAISTTSLAAATTLANDRVEEFQKSNEVKSSSVCTQVNSHSFYVTISITYVPKLKGFED